MQVSSGAVAQRNKEREESVGALTICIACTLGVAVVCGAGKLISDMKKTQPLRRRKQPWELD
jgi:hypothetical protein